jgi:negative regulator of sigma-B (phosphoserine phosphatase)
VAWLSHPCTGETLNGDAVVVREYGSDVLIAVIDGLGHGPKAADVAQAARTWLEAATPSADGALGLTRGLHSALQGSRGAAALVLLLAADRMEACSVGNVELRSSLGTLPFVLTPGVLGVRLRQPKVCSAPRLIAERLVLFTDGISGRFDQAALRPLSPQDSVSHIFSAHRHKHDDASVVVVDLA